MEKTKRLKNIHCNTTLSPPRCRHLTGSRWDTTQMISLTSRHHLHWIIESTDSSIKLLPHLMSVWGAHDLKGQSLIPFSHTRILFTLLFFVPSSILVPSQCRWLEFDGWLHLYSCCSKEMDSSSFTLGMNYPVVFLHLLILTILSSSSPGNTWPGNLDAPIMRAWRLETLSWLHVPWLVYNDES